MKLSASFLALRDTKNNLLSTDKQLLFPNIAILKSYRKRFSMNGKLVPQI